jgi:ornithine carbamoyltransferase
VTCRWIRVINPIWVQFQKLLKTKHLLSLEKLPGSDIEKILRDAVTYKRERARRDRLPLAGQIWALIFSKSSTRTRVSFEVGIRELGGQTMFLNASEIQLGRGELVKDTARVLGRLIDGAVIRTFAQSDVEEFAEFSGIPTINALTDDEHPCQILADIMTFREARGPIAGKVVTFVGDGACNVPRSWMFAAGKLGFELRIAAPKKFQPPAALVKRAGGNISCTDDLPAAAKGADLLYTDVWVSMGKEDESAERLKILSGYQINRKLLKLAKPDALVMHCLPAYRGKEIDEETFEANANTIFTQAENRLHVQKAALNWMVS